MELRTAPIPQYSWSSEKQSLLLVLLFAVVLALPPLGWLMHWQGATLVENRNLATPPDFRHTKLADLPAKIDAYYDDHIGFRGAIIRASGNVLHRFLKEPSSEVIIGESPAPGQPNWYFYASEGIMDDRLGLGPLRATQLEAWRRTVEYRHAWLNRRGIAYVFVVVPEKSSVYPELLPDYIQSRLGSTRLDQMAQYMKDSHSPASFLDLRSTLKQAKAEGELYFPFDTHWNGRGLFYGYEAVTSALQFTFPDLAPGNMDDDFQIRYGPPTYRVDLASMLGLAATAPTPLLAYSGPVVPRNAPSCWPAGFDPSLNTNQGFYALEMPGQRRRLLVFHDSFFIAALLSKVSQPLAAHFERSYFAWLAPSDAAFRRFVEMEHPDVVVEEHGERALLYAPPPVVPFDPVTPQLPRAAGVPVFSIDRINARHASPDAIIARDGELRLEGWALDGSAQRPAAGVEIVIDDVAQPASYGWERSDVTALSRCPNCIRSGFVADLSAVGLSPGSHTLRIRVISANGSSYTEAVWGSIRIENGS